MRCRSDQPSQRDRPRARHPAHRPAPRWHPCRHPLCFNASTRTATRNSPYLHADFGPSPSEGTRWRVDVHTAALHRLAHLLNLHQVWGIGSPSTTSEP
jgi:hypothetical protein